MTLSRCHELGSAFEPQNDGYCLHPQLRQGVDYKQQDIRTVAPDGTGSLQIPPDVESPFHLIVDGAGEIVSWSVVPTGARNAVAIERAREHGWSRDRIGQHLVRNNHVANANGLFEQQDDAADKVGHDLL